MTTHEQQGTTRRTVGSAVAVGVAVVAGWLAVAGGVVMAVLAALGQVGAVVPVTLTQDAPATSTMVVPCVQGWPADGSWGCEPAVTPAVWPGGEPLPARPAGGLVVADVDELPPVTGLLADAPRWGGLLAAGVVVLLLVPVLRSTAGGRPFDRGNGRRLALAAGVVVVAWAVAAAGPALAAPTVVELVETTVRYTSSGPMGTFRMPTGWLAPDPRVTWWPLLPALLLAGLAAATHAGARLQADTEGLV